MRQILPPDCHLGLVPNMELEYKLISAQLEGKMVAHRNCDIVQDWYTFGQDGVRLGSGTRQQLSGRLWVGNGC